MTEIQKTGDPLEQTETSEPNESFVLPLVPLRNMTVFPHVTFTFEIARNKSRAAVNEAMEGDQRILLLAQRSISSDWPERDNLYEIGTIAQVEELIELPGRDLLRIRVTGLGRGRLLELRPGKHGDMADHAMLERVFDPGRDEKGEAKIEAYRREVVKTFQIYATSSGRLSMENVLMLSNMLDPEEVTDVIISNLSISFVEQQTLLETLPLEERMKKLLGLIRREMRISEFETELAEKVKEEVDKNQKEYYLREQMKVITRELGEEQDVREEVDEYTKRLAELDIPEEFKEKLTKEIKRLPNFPSNYPEAATLRTYLDTIMDLPWGKMNPESEDFSKVRKQLNQDHYGLEDVKERILEYLAVRKLHNSKTDEPFKAPILCFVGPPGVGKTSVAQSIAQTLDRKFVRMSLGGIRDEAEIRGHRRTYVGAIPGRIIAAIQQAKTDNPLILLDEIDKVGSDFRGDPSSALLEVLDPEQNTNFRDHYLEVPYDLSRVMFITTANTTSTIQQALLDRMEVIQLSGYTEQEKYEIAKRHLLPKQMKINALEPGQLKISSAATYEIIRNYTREAGVRQLERELSRLCRKAVLHLTEKQLDSAGITVKNLSDYLGNRRFHYEKVDKEDPVGVVTGLAWTAVGGDTLTIEVSATTGTGKLNLTGNLGDVMKESAQVALAYVRSRKDVNDKRPDFPDKTDIHIHVPEGAVPKDGPSAGITLASAIYSALMEQPVQHDLAMTGEITIRGRVLTIGGLKEKIIAAHRAGVKKVLIPEDNRRDISDVPDSVRKKLEIIPVKNADEVLERMTARS